MPHPFEKQKLKLPGLLDRRRKLTDADKATILARYKGGATSLNALAREYSVSKKTILLIVNPESKAKNDKHIKDNWKKYQEHGEDLNRTHREHRAYKNSIFKEGLLVP